VTERHGRPGTGEADFLQEDRAPAVAAAVAERKQLDGTPAP
jgi:hypothetical protein